MNANYHHIEKWERLQNKIEEQYEEHKKLSMDRSRSLQDQIYHDGCSDAFGYVFGKMKELSEDFPGGEL